jgi:acyl-CoA synthetase (AMP-forming)/AMP-acid ligase II
MLSRVIDLVGDGPADVPTLTSIAYGGARTPRPVIERALRIFPNVGFVNAYGLTETSSTIAILGPADHRAAIASNDPAVRARLGSIGRPVPGIDVQIRDELGASAQDGQVGALWVRGTQVSGEYLGQGTALDAEGWFPTRDLCYRDPDGYLFIAGRADDTIIRGAENVAPAEIEDVLINHAGVKDVAVVGVPDDEWGEMICAVVVRERGADPSPDELKAYVRERLRGSRTPDTIVWSEELPHGPTGKLLRRQLVTELAETLTINSGEP